MNKIVPVNPIKPENAAIEAIQSFTDALRTLEYFACSGLLKNPVIWKIKPEHLNQVDVNRLFEIMIGKSVYIAFFEYPLFDSLNKGIDLIKSPQDVDWN